MCSAGRSCRSSIRRSNSPATDGASGNSSVKFERRRYFFILDHWKDEPLLPLQDHVERLAGQKAEAYLLVFSANPYGETERKNASRRRPPRRRAESGHSSIRRPDRKRRGLRVLGRGLARCKSADDRPRLKRRLDSRRQIEDAGRRVDGGARATAPGSRSETHSARVVTEAATRTRGTQPRRTS